MKIKSHRYTLEQIKYLKKIYKGRPVQETTDMFNKKFRTKLSYDNLRCFAQRHGMKNGLKYDGRNHKIYFKEHIDYLKKIIKGQSHVEITKLFNKHFNLSLTIKKMKSLLANYKLNTGRTGYFEKGHVPFNKGRKGVWYAGCEVSWFKKGHKPKNWRPVGSERINAYGYVEIKVSNTALPVQRRWKSKHTVIYENKHGPVPEGHMVVFLDGNKMNMSLNNLMVVSRAEHTVMCHMNLYTKEREITKANIATVKIKIAVSGLKKRTFKVVKNKKIVFLNGSGYRVFVTKNKNRYIPVRETNTGKFIRLRAKDLKSRSTRQQAQRDLYEYAYRRGWQRI